MAAASSLNRSTAGELLIPLAVCTAEVCPFSAMDHSHRFKWQTITLRFKAYALALMGWRGHVCIVDVTLVDGMTVGWGPCAALDVRLLDA